MGAYNVGFVLSAIMVVVDKRGGGRCLPRSGARRRDRVGDGEYWIDSDKGGATSMSS